MSDSSFESSSPRLPEPIAPEKYRELLLQSKPPEPFPIPRNMRRQIVQRLAHALDEASIKVQQAMRGESGFRDEGERKTALDLVKMLPRLLPLMKTFRDHSDVGSYCIP